MTMHEWQRELLVQRVRELNGAKFSVNGIDYYGAPDAEVNDLIKTAIRYIDMDMLAVAERWCEQAEAALLAALAPLRRRLP